MRQTLPLLGMRTELGGLRACHSPVGDCRQTKAAVGQSKDVVSEGSDSQPVHKPKRGPSGPAKAIGDSNLRYYKSRARWLVGRRPSSNERESIAATASQERPSRESLHCLGRGPCGRGPLGRPPWRGGPAPLLRPPGPPRAPGGGNCAVTPSASYRSRASIPRARAAAT